MLARQSHSDRAGFLVENALKSSWIVNGHLRNPHVGSAILERREVTITRSNSAMYGSQNASDAAKFG